MQNSNLTKKLAELELRLKEAMREKGIAAAEGGGWHDNAAYEILQQEEMMLRERLQNFKELLRKQDSEK